MKLWLSKNSEIPLRKQLVEQISLGVASGDLEPGERLPSTNELSRRFAIHQNTVSAAYRELERRGIVEFRRGSGFFVRARDCQNLPNGDLDGIIDRFLYEAASCGHSIDEIQARLRDHFEAKAAARILLVESDPELEKILVNEIVAATDCNVDVVTAEGFQRVSESDARQVTALFDEKEKIDDLPGGRRCIFLRANSVPASITGHSRPGQTDLICIVSAWKRFSELARLYLLAAGIDAEAIVLRSQNDAGWRKGLKNASLLICDSHSAGLFSANDQRLRIFPIIAESSLNELRTSIKNFPNRL